MRDEDAAFYELLKLRKDLFRQRCILEIARSDPVDLLRLFGYPSRDIHQAVKFTLNRPFRIETAPISMILSHLRG